MHTILRDKISEEKYEEAYKIEADVIVTAVVLGFIGTRYHLNQPCQFDYEYPSPDQQKKWEASDHIKNNNNTPKDYAESLSETEQFQHVLSALTFVLDKNEPGFGSFLKGEQSPEWKKGALITGRSGGQMMSFDDRHKDLQNRLSVELAEQIATNPNSLKGEEALYLSKGAYTGMIDDTVNGARLVQRTKRVIDSDKARWYPEKVKGPWGLIKDKKGQDINLFPLDKGGLGELPSKVADGAIIGYIHGMTSAIVKAVSAGPWCTPYELAAGEETTKMASCFACTTYMYATGFPPSSSHLGSGASWVPPNPRFETGEAIEDIGTYREKFDPQVMHSLLTLWNWDIYHYLRLGTKYLLKVHEVSTDEQMQLKEAGIDKKVIEYIRGDYAEAVQALDDRLAKYKGPEIGDIGGSLYLDALTVHDSDWRRIKRTLEPIFNHFDKRERVRQLDKDIAAGNILVSGFVADKGAEQRDNRTLGSSKKKVDLSSQASSQISNSAQTVTDTLTLTAPQKPTTIVPDISTPTVPQKSTTIVPDTSTPTVQQGAPQGAPQTPVKTDLPTGKGDQGSGKNNT